MLFKVSRSRKNKVDVDVDVGVKGVLEGFWGIEPIKALPEGAQRLVFRGKRKRRRRGKVGSIVHRFQ